MADTEDNLMKDILTMTFDRFDKSGDGYMEAGDFYQAVAASGASTDNNAIEAALGGNAVMTKKEFIKAVTLLAATKDPKTHLIDAFEKFDNNDNGTVDTEEVRYVLEGLSQMAKEDVEEFIKLADPMKSGRVEYKPLVKKLFA